MSEPIEAKPVQNPDYEKIMKKIMDRFKKTLAYLAKH